MTKSFASRTIAKGDVFLCLDTEPAPSSPPGPVFDMLFELFKEEEEPPPPTVFVFTTLPVPDVPRFTFCEEPRFCLDLDVGVCLEVGVWRALRVENCLEGPPRADILF